MPNEKDGFQITCDICAIWFVVPTEWREQKIKDASPFYCPNGHEFVYDRRRRAKDAISNFNQTNPKIDRT